MMKTIRTIVLAGCVILLHSCASGQHDQAFQDLELGVAIPCEADPTQLFLIAASPPPTKEAQSRSFQPAIPGSLPRRAFPLALHSKRFLVQVVTR
jgi:hypothetical protein